MPTTVPTGFIYPDNNSEASINVAVATLAGSVEAKVGPFVVDTGWLPLINIPAAWEVVGGVPPAVRLIGKVVYFRGLLRNNTFSGGFTTIARLPNSFPRPVIAAMAPMAGNTTAIRSVQVLPDGNVQVWFNQPSGAWHDFSSLTYVLD